MHQIIGPVLRAVRAVWDAVAAVGGTVMGAVAAVGRLRRRATGWLFTPNRHKPKTTRVHSRKVGNNYRGDCVPELCLIGSKLITI